MNLITIFNNRDRLCHADTPAQRKSPSRRASGFERLRRALFWAHLASGVVAGLFIAVMSATGVLLAFDEEILAYLDREALYVEGAPGARPRPLDALLSGALAAHPAFESGFLTVPSAADEAYVLSARGAGSLYLDPYTGEATAAPSSGAHDALHIVEEVHRFLALEGDARSVGALVQGIANLALVFLCLSGLVLWFPRRWTRKTLRPLLLLVRRKGARARDFNLHAVFGFWSLLALLVVAGSAVPISFEWAHALVFAAVGEEAPAERGFRMMRVPPSPVAAPAEGEARLPLEEVRSRLAESYPGREALVFSLARPRPGAEEAPLDVHVLMPDLFSTRGRVMVQVDPYRGAILSSVAFADRSPGLRARVWMRFLHTGEAFGLPGKLIAALASAAALVLVFTGSMLCYRRLLRWRA